MGKSDPSLTPEKRLLQLIEGGHSETARKVETEKKENILDKLKEAFSGEGLKKLTDKETWTNLFKEKKDFVNLKGVNRLAKLVTLALACYLGFSLFYEIRVVNPGILMSFDIPEKEFQDVEMSETKIFQTNLVNEAEDIHVFVPHSKRETKKEEKKDEVSIKLIEIVKDWKLAGISIDPVDNEKTYCMIEDLQKNITTFLKIGDSVSGLKVEEINSDGIILRFNSETIELR